MNLSLFYLISSSNEFAIQYTVGFFLKDVLKHENKYLNRVFK